MSGTNFIDKDTVITAVYMNGVNAAIYDAIGNGIVPPTTTNEVKTNLSLNNVDNTSDVNKPVSTAQQTALNLKSDLATTVTKDSSVGAANMPSGTYAQRPGTPSTGMLRYSSSVAGFEGYNGSTWVTFVTSANVSAGTYTPTVTNSNNVASVDATDLFLWSRVGDIVTTSGKVLITPTTSGVETRFLITLPVSSNLATTDDLTGVMNVRKSSGEQWSGVVAGDSSDKALTRYTPNLTGSHYCYVTFQFIVK